ncbi:MAG: glycosyltransferase family 2 protein [Candidatus Omnitrophota bacterium]
MYKGKRVSAIFPAYNEEENIISAIEDFFTTSVVDEIIVVDNNSKDKTASLVRQSKAVLVSESKQGYGFALQRGLKEATGDFIILAEPDGTFIGKDIFKLLSYCEDFQMVLGTRTAKELIWHKANMNFFLRFGNVIVAKFLEFLYSGPCLTDCGCTLRLINKDALREIEDDFSVGKSHFLPEMVILALKKHIRIIEIPVNYRPRVGKSKITGSFLGSLITGLNMIGLIIGYKFR